MLCYVCVQDIVNTKTDFQKSFEKISFVKERDYTFLKQPI